MARSEARLKFGIWRGLTGASAPAKLLYCVLLTDDSVNYAGVGRYCPELWAQNAEMPLDRVEKALSELSANDWIVVDGFSFLIRTMIRNDGVADQPNMLKAALREAQQVHSPKIRKVLAAELRKLPGKRPDTVKGGKVFSHPDPHAVADELDPPSEPRPPKGSGTVPDGSGMVPDPFENHPGNPSGEPIDGTLPGMPSTDGSNEGMGRTPRGRGGGRGSSSSSVGKNSSSVGAAKRAAAPHDGLAAAPATVDASSTRSPASITRPDAQDLGRPAAEGRNRRGAATGSPGNAKGCRIPADFAVSPAMADWARKETPDVDTRFATAKFVDFWTAKSGKDATKLDWPATWRNWMRGEQERAPRSPHLRAVPSPSPDLHTFEDLRSAADARSAARVLGLAYLPDPQPPSDSTPAATWARDQALAWIDRHETQLRAALAERSTA